MTRIIMHGCNGRMGHMVSEIAYKDPDVEIVAGVDIYDANLNEYPVFRSIDLCDIEADCIIDFGAASAVDALLDHSVKTGIPVVLCTTGLTDEELKHVKEASGKVAILRSANMSLGINTLLKILKDATKVFADAGFDIEIVEKHHRMKLDAPSGTALALADSINEAAGGRYRYTYDRSERRSERPDDEIGISAVRGGTIVGDHDIIFAGEDEVITFSHRAYSRAVFAKGAIQAAKFLKGRSPGLYSMSQVVG